MPAAAVRPCSAPTGRAPGRRGARARSHRRAASKPLFRSQVRTRVEGLDVLDRPRRAGDLRRQPRLAPRHPAGPAVAARRVAAAHRGRGGGRLLLRHLVARGRLGAASSTPSRSTGAAARMATTPGEVLADGWNLVIFPEGTRTHDGWVGRFRTGAAFLAVRHGVPVVPIAHRGTFAAMPRGQGWPAPRPPPAHPPLRRAGASGAGRDAAQLRPRVTRRGRRAARRGPLDLVGRPTPRRDRRHPDPSGPAGRAVAPGVAAERVAGRRRSTAAWRPGGAEAGAFPRPLCPQAWGRAGTLRRLDLI